MTDRADRHGFLTSSAFASGSGSVSTPLKSNWIQLTPRKFSTVTISTTVSTPIEGTAEKNTITKSAR